MISSALVPLDALGAGFQLATWPCGVEHEDRVVLHASTRSRNRLLAAAQLLLRASLRGDVLDLQEQVQRLPRPLSRTAANVVSSRRRVGPGQPCSSWTTSPTAESHPVDGRVGEASSPASSAYAAPTSPRRGGSGSASRGWRAPPDRPGSSSPSRSRRPRTPPGTARGAGGARPSSCSRGGALARGLDGKDAVPRSAVPGPPGGRRRASSRAVDFSRYAAAPARACARQARSLRSRSTSPPGCRATPADRAAPRARP